MNAARSRLLSAASFTLIAALLASCESTPAVPNDSLIVPGERVGGIQIGMPLSALLQAKGTPLSTVPMANTEGATTYAFEGMSVAARDNVYWIIAENPRFHTANGIAPGSEQITARAAFGKPQCVVTRGDETIYDYANVYFTVDNGTGKVRQIGILQKTEFCKK